jgi:hypothetical protein
MRPPESLDPAVERELADLDAALRRPGADPALDALVAAVREERPIPDAAFTGRLDHEVASGFAREPRHLRRAPKRRRLKLGFAVPAFAASILVALVVVVAVISDGARDEQQSAGGGASTASQAQSPAPEESGGSAGTSTDSASGGSSVAPPAAPETRQSDRRKARKVERSAALVLATPRADVATVADGVVRVTDRAGGFVRSSSVRTDDATGGSGTFELRVPASRLERTLAELSRLAHVRERTQDVEDITPAYASARSRLTEARAERRGLLRRLAAASTAADAAAIRSRLRTVNRRIARAEAETRRVSTRAAFSSIAVSLVADDDAPVGGTVPDDGRWSPGDALRDAGRVLEVAFAVAVLVGAVALPLVLLAIPGAVVWRQGVRRRRERALDGI